MSVSKQPNVAGSFYPAQQLILQKMVVDFLTSAKPILLPNCPKAMIVPHAGYIYSGYTAAVAYRMLANFKNQIKNVVLIGPSHFVSFFGIATTHADQFITPVGGIAVNHQVIDMALQVPQVKDLDIAFEREHCLEVQLPFLSQVLSDFKIAPFLVGNASYLEVAELIKKIWGGPETIIIISSDLSHYYDYKTAKILDQETSTAIEELQIDKIGQNAACGRLAIQGLLQCAIDFGLKVTPLDLRNSGDTAGDKSRVVGYGAYYLC